MPRDNLADHRQRAGEHRHARLSALRRKRERIFFPIGVLVSEALLDLAARKPLPMPVRDLTEPVSLSRHETHAPVMMAAVSALRDSGLQYTAEIPSLRSRSPSCAACHRPSSERSAPSLPENRPSAVSWVDPCRTRYKRVGFIGCALVPRVHHIGAQPIPPISRGQRS